MKRETIRRAAFVGAACLLSFPWLTPCTLGIGTVGAALVSGASRRVGGDDAVHQSLRDPQLKAWAAKPGPQLKTNTQARIPRSFLIQDAELATQGKIQQVGSKDSLARTGSTSAMNSVATLFALSDLTTQMVAGAESGMTLSPWPSTHKKRREIVLSQSPYVLLQATEIVYARNGTQPPHLVRATGGARVTVITPDGTFFALATRIHFRGTGAELLLEGNPTVQSGHQHIKSGRTDALMKLDFITRTVSIASQAAETTF